MSKDWNFSFRIEVVKTALTVRTVVSCVILAAVSCVAYRTVDRYMMANDDRHAPLQEPVQVPRPITDAGPVPLPITDAGPVPLPIPEVLQGSKTTGQAPAGPAPPYSTSPQGRDPAGPPPGKPATPLPRDQNRPDPNGRASRPCAPGALSWVFDAPCTPAGGGGAPRVSRPPCVIWGWVPQDAAQVCPPGASGPGASRKGS
jgi:hypothetical protein